MTFQGTVRNGVVVLETDVPPPEGTLVDVHVRADREQGSKPEAESESERFGSWVDVVMKYAGCMEGLPADFAAEHDHYIHGTPKRSETTE